MSNAVLFRIIDGPLPCWGYSNCELPDQLTNNEIDVLVEYGIKKKKAFYISQIAEAYLKAANNNSSVMLGREIYKKLAKRGYWRAELWLGSLYKEERNYNLAIEEYEKIASKGNVCGDSRIFEIFKSNLLSDKKIYFTWLKNAASRGFLDAIDELVAIFQEADESQRKKYREEISCVERALLKMVANGSCFETENDWDESINFEDPNEDEAQVACGMPQYLFCDVLYNLATIYQFILTSEQSNQHAFKYYNEAAKFGSNKAECTLGFIYQQGLIGIAQNNELAIQWFEKAANNFNYSACHQLGLIYLEGKGVKSDSVKAIQYLKKAAYGGNVEAQIDLGIAYFNGKGVEKDDKEARLWFEKAKHWSLEVCELLGLMYMEGWGIDVSLEKARQLFLAISEHSTFAKGALQELDHNYKGAKEFYLQSNSLLAEFRLGRLFEYGWGVKENHRLALERYRKSASNGFTKAKDAIVTIKKKTFGIDHDEYVQYQDQLLANATSHWDVGTLQTFFQKKVCELEKRIKVLEFSLAIVEERVALNQLLPTETLLYPDPED